MSDRHAQEIDRLMALVGRLTGELESATASVVALSGQCDRLTARCEQQERDHAETVAEVERLRERLGKATRFQVSCLPEGHDARRHFVIHVEYRGRDSWAVVQPGEPALCLGADGDWDWEMRPSERTDEWIKTHRFDLDAALRLAEKHAPTLTVNGRTAADVLARDAERERES